jgi:hypothetical protein
MSDEEAVYECAVCLDTGIRMAPQGPWPCRCERGRWAVDSFFQGTWSTPTDEPKPRSEEERDRLHQAEYERELEAIHAESEHDHWEATTHAEERDAPPVERASQAAVQNRRGQHCPIATGQMTRYGARSSCARCCLGKSPRRLPNNQVGAAIPRLWMGSPREW